jgi:hypothetical protein
MSDKRRKQGKGERDVPRGVCGAATGRQNITRQTGMSP